MRLSHLNKAKTDTLMKPIIALLVGAFLLSVTFTVASDKEDPAAKSAEEPVFREPFTLKLHVDKERFYEEKFGKVPFVHDGNVYLFKGDNFGLTLEIKEHAIQSVKYQPDLKKADLTLKFTENKLADGAPMMLLKLHNKTKETLNVDALMTVPGQKGIAKTNILPISPGLSGFESWPHPIVQLVLRNIRIGK